MNFVEAAAMLAGRFPKQSRLIDRVRKLGIRARAVERQVILEPVSLQDLSEEKPKLFGLTPADYNAWRLHVAESAAVRMQDLEDGVVSELLQTRLSSSLILLRAHIGSCWAGGVWSESAVGRGRAAGWMGKTRAYDPEGVLRV
jgi:hypothetical protein